MEIVFAQKKDFSEIAKLSKLFEKENCCNGIVADTKDYYKDKITLIAKIDKKIVGYLVGSFEIKKSKTSFANAEDKCFYIEEIYVLREFRNKTIGQFLFNHIEQYAKSQNCSFIEVTAVSKDYKKLLSFYIDKLNLQFWSATLIKKI